MHFAEDQVYEYLRKNLNLLNYIKIDEILNCLRGVLTVATGEQLDRNLKYVGNSSTRFEFLNNLQQRDDWVNQFLRALWECENRDLYYKLRDVYKSYGPSRVWEPNPPPYSLPHLPHNNNELPPLDSPQRCVSLPPEASNSFREPQPGPPVAPSPNQVQPEQASGWGHQPHQRSDPSTHLRAPMPRSPPPATVLAHPGSPLDQVDNMTSEVGISKRPVPESSPYPPPPYVGSQTEAASPPERSLPPASSLPARTDLAMTQPLQEKSENREVPPTAEQPTSVVNTPRKDVFNEPPHSPVNQEVAGIDAPNSTRSPTSSTHEVNKGWTSALPRELPGPSQGASTPPAVQHFEAYDACSRQPVESPSNPEISSSSQRLSGLSLGSGANAGLHSEQPRIQQSVQPSSCRPTNVNIPWNPEKPGVLMSSAGFADVRGNTNEVQPLSREPILEISDDGSSNGHSACSHQPVESPSNPSVQPSSCRPTNVNIPWNPEKPGVLMSSAGFADVRGNTNEVQPLSREPILEISDDGSSNGHSRSSGSSQPSTTRDGIGSPMQREAPTTSTPKTGSLRSSPKKNPEENEEPRGFPGSAYGRPPNASPPQEAEENSFELSNDLGYYRLRYNEHPSVDLMSKNSLPHLGTNNPSEIKDKNERAASEEREKTGQSNLHNPVVISLSAVVVCLSIYILWLKVKK